MTVDSEVVLCESAENINDHTNVDKSNIQTLLKISLGSFLPPIRYTLSSITLYQCISQRKPQKGDEYMLTLILSMEEESPQLYVYIARRYSSCVSLLESFLAHRWEKEAQR